MAFTYLKVTAGCVIESCSIKNLIFALSDEISSSLMIKFMDSAYKKPFS